MSNLTGCRNACYQLTKNGIELFVKLTPNASRDEIIGVNEADPKRHRIAAKVRAVPEKGRANKALEKLLAKQLRMAKSSFRVTQGLTSRLKTLSIIAKPSQIAESLEHMINTLGNSKSSD